jgi:polyferredoxin
VWVLLGLFYGLPWVHWDGRQAVLFDLPARKFYLFGLTLWPQDFIFLTWLLVIAALSLFFFTASAAGCGAAMPARRPSGPRPSCGWNASPRAIAPAHEARQGAVERRASSARRRQAVPVDHVRGLDRLHLRRLLHAHPHLGGEVLNFGLGPWETFWVLFYGFATYGNAGFLREQVCKYMCPYARFQSAMFDDDT